MHLRALAFSLIAAPLFLGTATAFGAPIKRIQYPAISPDGTEIVFSWQGDLWQVSRNGGMAKRLTVHAAEESRPEWFPDGKRIAFTSRRFGSVDIFTMRPDGSDIQRVTHESGTEALSAVSPDGRWLYGHTSAWGRIDLFKVSATGGDLIRLTDHPLETEFLPVVTPDGKSVIYNRGNYRETAWQKPGMVSSALPDIWVADNTTPLSNHRQLTKNENTDLQPNVTADGSVFFISNRSGWPNVWRMNRDGSGAKALTTHTDATCRNLSVSSDGKFVVYEVSSELHLLDVAKGTTQRLEVEVPSDDRANPMTELALTTGAESFAASPDGKRAVIGLRGELFLLPEKGGTTRQLTKNPGRDFSPVWIDNKTILYVAAGAASKRSLKTVNLDGVVKDFITDGTLDLVNPLLSPDGKSIAFQAGAEEIRVVAVVGGEAKTVAKGYFQQTLTDAGPFSWSPDNKWLTYASLEGRRVNVMLTEVATGRQVNAARLVFKPQGSDLPVPKFLPNGRAIYFTSPEFENNDLFVVDLVPNEVTFTEDDLDKIDAPKPAAKSDVKVEVDERGIQYRLRRLTSTGASDPIASPDSKTIWANVDRQFSAIPVAGGAATAVAGVTGPVSWVTANPAGTKLYLVNTGRLQSLTPGAPPAPISFSAQFSVDRREEEKALFDEIGWAMDRLYYDPQHHGKSWAQIRDKFAKIVPFTYDRSDFYALMGEMMEELDSSHLGATAPPAEVPGAANDSTGFLGIDIDPKALESRGVHIVARVVPNSPADHPQSLLKVGDRILSVDGVEPTRATPLAALLNRKVGRKVVLQVERGPSKAEITIRPGVLAQRTPLEYEAFVAWQREMTNKLSNGQLGYVHIQGMDQPSYERFLREIRTEGQGKKGLLVDVRFNGGGSTAHQVLGVLIKTPWLVRTTRGTMGSKMSENQWRGDALELPTALLVNSASFSNAEIIAEGWRRLKQGPIIGERTPGYVIGTGGFQLWDGGFIRMPQIGAYAIDGENLENNGRRPDFLVPFEPNSWSAGRDLQLEKAVQELLKQIK